jgi:hypothetical protein
MAAPDDLARAVTRIGATSMLAKRKPATVDVPPLDW